MQVTFEYKSDGKVGGCMC